MKERLQKLLKAKEARKAELVEKSQTTDKVDELRSINAELTALNNEIAELRGMIDAIKDEEPAEEKPAGNDEPKPADEQRSAAPVGKTQVLASYGVAAAAQVKTDDRAAERAEAEKRGKMLMEGRSITVGSSNIILPAYQATDIRPTFNEVSSLLDRVQIKRLVGGESFKQPYLKGYGTAGYATEAGDPDTAEPVFGYADINKAKIAAYAEDTEEVLKLPAADYDTEVQRGIRIAIRKKITREILLGGGSTNQLVGIFSAAATAIEVDTDLPISEIDETTLDEIIYTFGGDEDVEDPAVLVLNKKDLKAFAMLRTADGKKVHQVTTRGNFGDIDGIPFIINSACNAISDSTTADGAYCMAYGPLSNYMLTIFSDIDIARSTDYKFKQGMIAHRGVVFIGGNVVSQNGFLRVKKG
jgi:HK97 family phage major capsid protein